MKIVDDNLKYITVYAGIIYAFGFLILSTRLATLQIFIKDFFTLDYLKAGVLFFFINFPIYSISREFRLNTNRNFIISQLLSIILSIVWICIISPLIFKSYDFNWESGLWIFLAYPALINMLSKKFIKIKLDDIKSNGMELGLRMIFILTAITAFSNIIFPQINFKFGGGAFYEKTLIIENNLHERTKIKAKVYYENDDWIHYLYEDKIISLPKSSIIREESEISKNSLFHFNNLKK